MSEPVLVPVPPSVVTEIWPEVAPAGIVTASCVAEITVHEVADVPPIFTAVAPARFVPVRVIAPPAAPAVGENEEMVGATGVAVTVKFVALVPVASPTVTAIGPVVAPAGTEVTIEVALRTVQTLAGVPPIVQVAGEVKFVPVTVIAVPTPPEVGVKPAIESAELEPHVG